MASGMEVEGSPFSKNQFAVMDNKNHPAPNTNRIIGISPERRGRGGLNGARARYGAGPPRSPIRRFPHRTLGDRQFRRKHS